MPVSLLPFLLFHLLVALINTALAISMPTVVYPDPYLPQDLPSEAMAKKPLGKRYLHWLYNAPSYSIFSTILSLISATLYFVISNK